MFFFHFVFDFVFHFVFHFVWSSMCVLYVVVIIWELVEWVVLGIIG